MSDRKALSEADKQWTRAGLTFGPWVETEIKEV